MPAELNFFDTYTLMAVYKRVVPKKTFFRDRYFPTSDEDIFASNKVLTEYMDGDQKMAAFVAPRVGAIPMERMGYEIHELEPAFIGMSRELSTDDLTKRGFGEAIYANSTPAQRAAKLTQKDLADMDARIVRREEWMCAQTMSAAYDKLLTTLGLTDEQFKLTYGTVEDLPWRTMSEDVQQLRTEYMGYSDDLVTARREVENYTAAVEQDQEAINAAEAEYQEASAAVDALNASQQSAADSADDVAAQQQNVANAISDAELRIQDIIAAYKDAYDEAYGSISGQYALWDSAEKVVSTSATSINNALQSQITYWDNYNQNLEKLNERAADIDGLSEVIASFADGSKESVPSAAISAQYHIIEAASAAEEA